MNQRLVENILVIDIDPSLTLFKPNCKYASIPARVEMDLQSRTHLLTPQRQQIQPQNHTHHPRNLPTSRILRKK